MGRVMGTMQHFGLHLGEYHWQEKKEAEEDGESKASTWMSWIRNHALLLVKRLYCFGTKGFVIDPKVIDIS